MALTPPSPPQEDNPLRHSVPLFLGDHAAFARLMDQVDSREHRLPDLLEILGKYVSKDKMELLKNDFMQFRLSQAHEAAVRILGEEKILAFLLLFVQHGIEEAIEQGDEERFDRLSYMAEIVYEQLLHEARTNVVTREDYILQILRRHIFAKEPQGSFDFLRHAVPQGSSAPYDVIAHYRGKLCQGIPELLSTPGISKEMTFTIIEEGLEKQLRHDVLPHVEWPAGSNRAISVFDHLLSMVQEGLEHMQIAYHPVLGSVENAAKTMWNDARIQEFFAYLSPLIYATVEHRVEKKNTFHTRKNLFILYGTSLQYLRQIQQATLRQQERFPEVYVRVGYEPVSYEEPCHTNRLYFDAWNPAAEEAQVPTNQTPQLLDTVHVPQQVLHGDHGGEEVMDTVNVLMFSMLKKVFEEQYHLALPLYEKGLARIAPVRWDAKSLATRG
jgi:hypothetical protein